MKSICVMKHQVVHTGIQNSHIGKELSNEMPCQERFNCSYHTIIKEKRGKKTPTRLQEQAVFISQQLHSSKATSALNKLLLALIGTLDGGSVWMSWDLNGCWGQTPSHSSAGRWVQRGKVQAAAPACAWQQPQPWQLSWLLQKNTLRYEESKCMHSHADIRWRIPAKILSVISNFEVCRDTYSLGIASV